jgi:hypothetical protein
MTLETVVDGLVTTLGTMTGIERAYADPPEALAQFPCLIAFAGSGTMEVVTAGLGKSLHTVIVEIHHSRTIVQAAIDAAKVWPDRVLAALYAAQKTSALYVVYPFTYESLPLPYNQETHYGVRFRITIKDMVTLT